MAGLNNTESVAVTDGTAPDSVDVNHRIWRLSPLRLRNPAPPDYSNAGLDVFLFGDDNDETVDPDLFGVATGVRNGAKRVADASGNYTLWTEPSPQRYDVWSSTSADLDIGGPAGGAGGEYDLGVWAEASVDADDGFPLIVTPVVDVDGALMEVMETTGLPPAATMQAELLATLSGTPASATRDLFYLGGGSTTLVLPAVVVPAGDSYSLRCDMKMVYRLSVDEAFTVAIQGLRIGLQCIEFTSAGA